MRSSKRLTRGFTLVEIMIVVAVIALIVSIALPNFLDSRRKSQTTSCKANLKQVDGAIQMCLLDTNLLIRASNAPQVLVPVYIRTMPTCPRSKEAYVIDSSSNIMVSCPAFDILEHAATI